MPQCVASRLDLLRSWQNADGGWGYFPGHTSWLEPTAYALLALAHDPESECCARGWRLLRSWQLPDGAWRACAAVGEPHWATSLVVTLHAWAGVSDERFRRGVRWLAGSTGTETRPLSRLAHWVRPGLVEYDPALSGWPWRTGSSAWVEPTAHALMALRGAARHGNDGALAGRIGTGERMLLERRCRDGGWNYGNRRVLGADLPSFPETTAMALMALDGHPSVDWPRALAQVEASYRQTRSTLGRAWLGACLALYGVRTQTTGEAAEPDAPDVVVRAVEAIPWERLAH